MQYRTYKLKQMTTPWTWEYPNADGSTGTFVNSDTLVYASGGAVANYDIDSDYMVANNSTVNITAKTKATAGQIIALIDDAGAYDLGVISSVDNENLKILYKSMLSLFDTDILNPTRDGKDGDSGGIDYLYDGVEGTGRILASYFATAIVDRYLRLPIFIRTSGGGKNSSGKFNVPAIWNYTDNTVNLRDWLIDLFDKHNVVLQFRLTFEVSHAYIEIYISHNTTSGRLLKGNIHGMTIKHTEEGGTKATVCQVIDSETKQLRSTWYLLSNNTVTTYAGANNRLQPYKLTVAEFDVDNNDGATEQTVAEDALLYGGFNHYINISIDRQSAMFPKTLTTGDAVRIVPEIEQMTINDTIDTNYDNKVYKSIFTGRKESSSSSMVTLIFGKIRINYTDIIQMQNMKKNRT